MTNPFRRRVAASLRNIYLDPLDRLMAERGYRMVRYADDFVILTGSREEADAALALVRSWVAENGLTLHPEKTRVGGRVEDARFQHDRQPGEGFEFLGYRFEAGRRDVRKKSFVRVKDVIREKTRRRRGDSLECVIADLNRSLRGWFGYFKHAHPFIFQTLDGFIRRRLRALLRRQEKRRGLGNSLADCRRWPNAFFATAGLFALHTAWHTARQSR
jgi:RNA-directed DNA polymerase